MERLDPSLASAMREDAEMVAKRVGHLSQLDQIRFFSEDMKRDLKRVTKLLEREGQG